MSKDKEKSREDAATSPESEKDDSGDCCFVVNPCCYYVNPCNCMPVNSCCC